MYIEGIFDDGAGAYVSICRFFERICMLMLWDPLDTPYGKLSCTNAFAFCSITRKACRNNG